MRCRGSGPHDSDRQWQTPGSADMRRLASPDVFDTVNPAIWDGQRLPYADRTFDLALLLTVLHHCPDPDAVLREAFRVAPTVVVIEDIFETGFERGLTYFFDSLFNWQWQARWLQRWQSAPPHPRSNRTDAEWRASFERNGWTLQDVSTVRFAGIFTQVLYCLSCQDPISTARAKPRNIHGSSFVDVTDKVRFAGSEPE